MQHSKDKHLFPDSVFGALVQHGVARWFDAYFPPIVRTRTYAKPSRRQSSSPNIPRPGYFLQSPLVQDNLHHKLLRHRKLHVQKELLLLEHNLQLPAGLIEEIRALAMPPIPWDVKLARWFDAVQRRLYFFRSRSI